MQRFAFAARTTGATSAGRVVAVAGIRVLAGRLVAAAQLLRRLLLLVARLRLRLLPKVGEILLSTAAHPRRRIVGRGIVVVAVVVLRRWLLLVMVGCQMVVVEVLLVLIVLTQLVQHRHRLVRVEGGGG